MDESVVNRIAAGEVVQKPYAAVKELIENSLDAGSTSISVTVKDGGLSYLQIQDNGHGISTKDMPIVCERFTTSKLTHFEDLKTIDTFGFRGEALASISHVAHVTITTRTKDSQCAYRAKYQDGQLIPMKIGGKAIPEKCAGTQGTTISVEDLFYNMPTRKNALKNLNEEYQRILDVVSKYSIHYGDKHIAFTCKKQGQSVASLNTPTSSSTLDNIGIVYGRALPKELLQLEFEINEDDDDDMNMNAITGTSIDGNTKSDKFSCKVSALISNANYSTKRGGCIIFINNRLVDCNAVKRTVENIYAELLPKNMRPFLYFSITMPSHHVDVNVHPTKKEVHFLFESELLEHIHAAVHAKLQRANESRTFYTQSVLPSDFVVTASSNQSQTKISSDEGPNNTNQLATNNDNDEIMESEDFFGGGVMTTNDKENRGSSDIDIVKQNIKDLATTGKRKSTTSGTSASASGIVPKKMVRVDPNQVRIDSVFHTLEDIGGDKMKRDVSFSQNDNTTTSEKYDTEETLANLFCGVCDSSLTIITDPSSSASSRQQQQYECECCVNVDGNVVSTPAIHARVPITPSTITNTMGSSDKTKKWTSAMGKFFETQVQYESIRDLLREVQDNFHSPLHEVIKSHTFVGIVNCKYTAVQYDTRLLLLDHAVLLKHLFYQLCLRRFACVPKLKLETPIDIETFVRASLDHPHAMWSSQDGDKDSITKVVVNLLEEKSEMLLEYFSITIEVDEMSQRLKLLTVPELLTGYVPNPEALPMFLLRLATDTDWSDEKQCFKSISLQVADFYSHLAIPKSLEKKNEKEGKRGKSDKEQYNNESNASASVNNLENTLRDLLLPAIKNLLITPSEVADKKAIVPVAALEQLYKVFERC